MHHHELEMVVVRCAGRVGRLHRRVVSEQLRDLWRGADYDHDSGHRRFVDGLGSAYLRHQEFSRYRQPDRWRAGHDRTVQIYPPPDLRGHPLFLLGGDCGPRVPGHRSGRPSRDGVYGGADRGGREAAGYNVPGVRSVCAGDEASGSVRPIGSRRRYSRTKRWRQWTAHFKGNSRARMPRALTLISDPWSSAASYLRQIEVTSAATSTARSRCCRIRTTEGRVAPVSARISGKSRSSVTITRDSRAAYSRISRSLASCIPISRAWTASQPLSRKIMTAVAGSP